MRLGLGLGYQQRASGGGGSPNASNTLAPFFFETNGYAGGPYNASEGIWSGDTTSTTMTLERSDDGVGSWTDEGALATVGTWNTALEGKYLRIKVVGEPGAVVAYSDVFGPLGIAYDHVIDCANGSNHMVTALPSNPPLGGSLTAATTGAAKGLWFSAMWYFPGTGYEADAYIAGFWNNVNDSLWFMGIAGATVALRTGGSAFGVAHTAPAAAGWYIVTGRIYSDAGTLAGGTCHFGPDTRTFADAGGVSLTNFTHFSEFRGNSNATNRFFDLPVAWIACGRGDPAAAHAWAYNGGKLRRIDEYDFASDANAKCDVFKLYSRKGFTTWASTQSVDLKGYLSSTPTQTGTFSWIADKPGFIDPTAPPPVTPAAFIFPRYADTSDANLTLCINTKKIGEALAGDLTITALTHSVAGDISGTVTGDTFPNPGVGTITGTVNGVAVACEIVQELAIPAYKPAFADRYNGNARVAAIENYTSPGAGTTYANVAALKAGIDALASGGTLIVADANFTGGGALTLTAKDYGGATITCTNRHGVILDSMGLTGVSNLTIRGFKTIGDFDGSNTNGVVIDHCTGSRVNFRGNTGATETGTLSNWCGPDDGTEGTMILSKFNRLTISRVAHSRAGVEDVCRTDGNNIIIQQRCYFGDNKGTVVGSHLDCQQIVGAGTQGFTSGLVLNCVYNDQKDGAEIGAQGISNTIGVLRNFRVKRVAARSVLSGSIALDQPDQGVSIVDCTVSARADVTAATINSCFVDNIVRGSLGTCLPTTNVGVETNVLAGVDMATAYPQWTSHIGTWEQWDNPAGGYTTAGAYALIDELAANKASYP